MNLLSSSQAAKILGVSGATVRNWCRAGHLVPAQPRPLLFTRHAVMTLKERIRTNRFNRLRKRANKTAADHFPKVEQYAPEVSACLARLGARIEHDSVRPTHIMFMAAMLYLQSHDEVEFGTHRRENIVPERLRWRRRHLREIMCGWRNRIPETVHPGVGDELGTLDTWRTEADPLGVLYQSLSSVGRSVLKGAYFTPKGIVDESLRGLGMTPKTFLDPCCGTGRYLLRAAQLFGLSPFDLYGFDSDPVAVDIARINLLLLHRDLDSQPNIHCLDSLKDLATGDATCATNGLIGTIDAVATNPPWGSRRNQGPRKNAAAAIRSGESFSLFLEKSLHLLRDGGRLSFLLPESMLKIKAHADIRALLLEKTTILKIALLGRVFNGVFTPIMRLDLEKRPAADDWMVTVESNRRRHFAPQKRFIANAGFAFDVAVAPRDENLLKRIYAVPHQTLKKQADWALGIVTGDNNRCVLQEPEPGAEPVLRGRDIFKFSPRKPRCFIRFKPEQFQQVAPERFYRAQEKLIYRFVSDQLVFAYDDRRYLTLNSANILIPKLAGMSIKGALAFLNSLVFQYIFTKRFRTRKILRGDLESLPFPLVKPDVLAIIERQVDMCMDGEYRPAEELDEMVFQTFGLGKADVKAIRESLAIEAETIIL